MDALSLQSNVGTSLSSEWNLRMKRIRPFTVPSNAGSKQSISIVVSSFVSILTAL